MEDRYPLEALLKLRQRHETVARATVVDAEDGCSSAREDLEQRRARVERAEEDARRHQSHAEEALMKGFTVAQSMEMAAAALALEDRLSDAKNALSSANRALSKATTRLEAARDALATAAREREVVQRHLDQWLREGAEAGEIALEEDAEEYTNFRGHSGLAEED